MSEPKTVAQQMDEVAPGVFHWQIEDERIRHISDAHAVVEGGRAVLIDPVPLSDEAMKRLGPIEAIVLAAPSHQRCAWSLRKRTGARVYAPKGSAARLAEKPDVEYGDGDALPGGLRAIHAPGPAAAHYVLERKGSPGVLFLTDLVLNEKDRGLVFLSDKYQDDPAQARTSARGLLEVPCGLLCFGHGAPLREEGRAAIQRLLASDKAKA